MATPPESTADCACGHSVTRVPETREEAMQLSGTQRTTESLLDLVVVDHEKWMRVLQCRLCKRYWAEEWLTSGHMDLDYVYPIHSADPEAWLAGAEPLDH